MNEGTEWLEPESREIPPGIVAQPQQRSRGWCFTLNNYVETDTVSIANISCRYSVVGREVGASGTRHLQGYIYFEEKKSFMQLKKLIPRANIQIARGTAQQNFVYCSKDGLFVEQGVRPYTQAEKGIRGQDSLREKWRLAIAGDFFELPPHQIKNWEYIHLRYGHEKPKMLEKMTNLWIHGKSGCGKSHWVETTFPDHYRKNLNKWWDHYEHHEVVVIQDFAPKHADIFGYFLKIWADRYPFIAEIKTASIPAIRPKRIIITSQYSIERCFPDREDYEAISRRFHEFDTGSATGFLDLEAYEITNKTESDEAPPS